MALVELRNDDSKDVELIQQLQFFDNVTGEDIRKPSGY
jgi:hypothetical protein